MILSNLAFSIHPVRLQNTQIRGILMGILGRSVCNLGEHNLAFTLDVGRCVYMVAARAEKAV